MKLSEIQNQNILFISPKEQKYIKTIQVLNILKQNGNNVTIICSNKKTYKQRLPYVYKKLLTESMKKYDAIFLGISSQMLIPFFWKFRKKFVITDFFLSCYDTFIDDRKKFKTNSFPAKIMKYVDKRLIKVSDHLLFDTNSEKEYFRDYYKIENKTLETLYIQSDNSIYAASTATAHKDRFNVLYFGTNVPAHGFEFLLQAAELLKDKKQIMFTFIGHLPEQYEYIKDYANVEYFRWLEPKDLANEIAVADLCVSGHFNGEIRKARDTIPTKAFIYDSMHKTILFGDNKANRELFSEEKKHYYFCEMSNAKAIADKILEVYRDLNEDEA